MPGTRLLAVVVAIAALVGASWLLMPQTYLRWLLPPLTEAPQQLPGLAADSSGPLRFPSTSPYGLDVILNDPASAPSTGGRGVLLLPRGASAAAPVPAMVLLHDSDGIADGREHDHAAWLQTRNIAALVVNYHRPRGIRSDFNYLLRSLAVTEFDALSDAFHALALLRTHPAIDTSRIGIIGFGEGGVAARFAMDARIARAFLGDSPGFRLHVDAYGPCYQNLQTTAITGAPLLTLRGDLDASNELPACSKREAELRALGASVESRIFKGAAHAWDISAPRTEDSDAPYIAGCELRYDASGQPTLNGRALYRLPITAERASRALARLRSADALEHCIDRGIIRGRDPKTRVMASTALAEFLQRHL